MNQAVQPLESPLRSQAVSLFTKTQDSICQALESFEKTARFKEDVWTRQESGAFHGGGGQSRVLQQGEVFEQAGVNFSEVYGTLPADMSQKLTGVASEQSFFATGVSLVIHPRSPMVPTTHANYRYLEVGSKCWFGGGLDLTPYYLFEEDATHFHQVSKDACDRFDPEYYPRFKKACDEYFYLPHRKEARGVGGLFFDYLGRDDSSEVHSYLPFIEAAAASFNDAYMPIVERRKNTPYTEEQRSFQLMRRGRYVEFNLLHDRGTLFGLRTGGRIESILMSLPPLVRWEYNHQVEPGSEEAKLLEVVKTPKEWV